MTGTDPDHLDITITHAIAVPPDIVWRAWTDPAHLKRWWPPSPVETIACEIDLRPGDPFRTVMRLPEGTELPSDGCFLEVVEHRRIVFTDALRAGWRPAEDPFFTAVIEFAATPDGGTRYTATAMHKNDADRAKHEAMGFRNGWSTCADQLAPLTATLQ